jgi:hypothetical protein
LHIAVDWPGDPGFKPGTLSYCAMSVVVSQTAQEIEDALTDVRRKRSLPKDKKGKDFEFKFAKTNLPAKVDFMQRVALTSFRAVVLIYDKDAMSPKWAWGKKDDLLVQLLAGCVLQLTQPEIAGSKMMIDGEAEAKKVGRLVRPKLSEAWTRAGLSARLRSPIVNGDSKDYDPLQLADMIGGAVVEAWQQGVPYTLLMRPVRGKVMWSVVAPGQPKPVP